MAPRPKDQVDRTVGPKEHRGLGREHTHTIAGGVRSGGCDVLGSFKSQLGDRDPEQPAVGPQNIAVGYDAFPGDIDAGGRRRIRGPRLFGQRLGPKHVPAQEVESVEHGETVEASGGHRRGANFASGLGQVEDLGPRRSRGACRQQPLPHQFWRARVGNVERKVSRPFLALRTEQDRPKLRTSTRPHPDLLHGELSGREPLGHEGIERDVEARATARLVLRSGGHPARTIAKHLGSRFAVSVPVGLRLVAAVHHPCAVMGAAEEPEHVAPSHRIDDPWPFTVGLEVALPLGHPSWVRHLVRPVHDHWTGRPEPEESPPPQTHWGLERPAGAALAEGVGADGHGSRYAISKVASWSKVWDVFPTDRRMGAEARLWLGPILPVGLVERRPQRAVFGELVHAHPIGPPDVRIRDGSAVRVAGDHERAERDPIARPGDGRSRPREVPSEHPREHLRERGPHLVAVVRLEGLRDSISGHGPHHRVRRPSEAVGDAEDEHVGLAGRGRIGILRCGRLEPNPSSMPFVAVGEEHGDVLPASALDDVVGLRPERRPHGGRIVGLANRHLLPRLPSQRPAARAGEEASDLAPGQHPVADAGAVEG